MKFYSNITFRLFVLIHILALISTIFIAFLSIIISGLGMSSSYTREVEMGLVAPTIGIMSFLICSIIILFLQQRKNYRFGYLMFASAPFDLYIVYKIFLAIPFWSFITWSFHYSATIWAGIFWIIIAFLIAVAAAVPFYVLIRLVRTDLKKSK